MKTAQLIFIATALLLSLYACQKKTPLPASPPPLERPVLTLLGQAKAPSVLLIPRQALSERAGIPGVFVLENQQARFRMVRTGKTDTTHVQVLSGLHGDETLVLGDLSAVHDGSPIKILETADKRT